VHNLTKALETAVTEGGDLGSLTYLKLYDDQSQKHNVPVAAAIDCLNHLFSTDSTPSVMLRSLGFNLLDRLLPVKDLIVRMAS
jgi:2-polyprenyl-6-methoxyphenol hydroxylase-like FAD-dependent oxidoreductase